MSAEKVDAVMQLYGQAKSLRGNWESHWREIAERMLPNYADSIDTAYVTPGKKNQEFVYDSTAAIALGRFASILDSLLTPRNQTWHRLQASDPDLNKNRQVRLWFDEVNRILFKERYNPTSNFSSQNQSNYRALGAFGTGCLFIDKLDSPNGGLRYKHAPIGETSFLENHQGIIDTVIRYFPMTARQAQQKWGDKVPEGIKNALGKNPDKKFMFIHCVKPNDNYDPTRSDFRGMAYSSLYVAEEGRKLMSEGGFSTMPYASSRYEQAPGEVYGRSPAMDVLPAVKTLNEQKKTMLKQGHRAVDPVLLAHDDGIIDSFSLKPGAINAGGVDRNGRPLVQALKTGNYQIGKDMMDEERRLINDTFLVTIFQILTETPAMTATEVMERTREKGILLAPTIGRQQSEYLGPLIDRELDVLAMQGKLPERPPILEEAGAEFEIQYDSPLSRAQRAEEAAGLMRTVESTLNIVNVTGDPSPLDHYNWDAIVPELSEINAVPTRWLNSAQKIAAERARRAEAQQRQQAVEAAPSMAALAKADSEG